MNDVRMLSGKTHRVLRVGLLVVAILCFAVVSRMSTSIDADFGYAPDEQYAGVVGMGAGVAENPVNRLAQEIAQRSTELDERERSIMEREQESAQRLLSEAREERRATILLLSGVASVLFLLVGANFYLDYVREHRRGAIERDARPTHEGELTTRL